MIRLIFPEHFTACSALGKDLKRIVEEIKFGIDRKYSFNPLSHVGFGLLGSGGVSVILSWLI